ncbi:hypothetical protein GOBAR_AA01705 [Gossypium barbadense]|uniref:Piwi domain-containing protein n=1 Tax=Gossypium barbadense TaxID=3634 RepID=A0A2P5YTF3_GOSBA|nr:hypothetical protein GOBAR_AA01705 [Gossypium barbadense]
MPKVCSLFKDKAPYHSTAEVAKRKEKEEKNKLQKMTETVSDKVDDCIIDFYTSSGKRKPDQIIISGMGLAFNQVLIKLLRLASSLTRSGTLKIVVIIGSPENVLHGTIMDNKVYHPMNNDFYLSTHSGMIGITRQTHYHVLLDQDGFSADDL